MTKRCCKCGVVQPLDNFYKNRGRPDGHQTVCKECTRVNNRLWHEANPGSHLRYYANYEMSPEQVEARRRRCIAWYRENVEHARERGRRWHAENPEFARAGARRSAATYKARKNAAFVEAVDPLIVLERDDGVCGICGEDVDPLAFHVDHVVPIAQGGEHSYANVQPAHPSCNQRKWARLDFEPLAA